MSHSNYPTLSQHAGDLALLAKLPAPLPVGGNDASNATTTQDGTPGGAQQQPQSPFGGQFMLLLLGLMVFMILMSVFSGRKEKRKRQDMLSTIKRHDRVMMSSGIIGTVTELQDDRIVLKVDESTNTRIQFTRSAVQSILKSASGQTSSSEEAEDAEDLIEAEKS